MNGQWDLAGALKRLLAFRDARDWQRFHTPKDLAAALSIEAGELQEVFLWQPALDSASVRADRERLARAREEVADCAIYLLLVAHELGIDLARAVDEKISSNEARYTVDAHRGVAKKAAKT